jgi:3-oxoacyl-[acyl-carrier protein] reductase
LGRACRSRGAKLLQNEKTSVAPGFAFEMSKKKKVADAWPIFAIHNLFKSGVSMKDLENKVILITGASSGIGAAAAVAFGRHGARVAVHYRARETEAHQIVAEVKRAGGDAAAFHADAMDTDSLTRLALATHAHFGRIDVLVNNAGGMIRRVTMAEASDAMIDEVFQLNARSAVAMSRSVIPFMKEQGGGSIVNVSSQAARTGGSPGSGLYAAAKAYVSNYTRGLSRELVRHGIRVNAIAPGLIDTPIHDDHTSAELLEKFRAAVPMRRMGTAAECAAAILFLASEELSSYVTGQIIEVNGGSIMP